MSLLDIAFKQNSQTKALEPTQVNTPLGSTATQRSSTLSDVINNVSETVGALLGDKEDALKLYNRQRELGNSYSTANLASDIVLGGSSFGVGSVIQKSVMDLAKDLALKEAKDIAEKTIIRKVAEQQVPNLFANAETLANQGQLLNVDEKGNTELNKLGLVSNQLLGTGIETLGFVGSKGINTLKGADLKSKIEPVKNKINEHMDTIKKGIDEFKGTDKSKEEPNKDMIDLNYEGNYVRTDNSDNLDIVGSVVKDAIEENNPDYAKNVIKHIFGKDIDIEFTNDRSIDAQFVRENGKDKLIISKRNLNRDDYNIGSTISHELTHKNTITSSKPLDEVVAYTDELIHSKNIPDKDKAFKVSNDNYNRIVFYLDNLRKEYPNIKDDIGNYENNLIGLLKGEKTEKDVLDSLSNLKSKISNKDMTELYGNEDLMSDTVGGSTKTNIDDRLIDLETLDPIVKSKRIPDNRKAELLSTALQDKLNLKQEPSVEFVNNDIDSGLYYKNNKLVIRINPKGNWKEILLDELKSKPQEQINNKFSDFQNKIYEITPTDLEPNKIKINEKLLKSEIKQNLIRALRNKELKVVGSTKETLNNVYDEIIKNPKDYLSLKEENGNVKIDRLKVDNINSFIEEEGKNISKKDKELENKVKQLEKKEPADEKKLKQQANLTRELVTKKEILDAINKRLNSIKEKGLKAKTEEEKVKLREEYKKAIKSKYKLEEEIKQLELKINEIENNLKNKVFGSNEEKVVKLNSKKQQVKQTIEPTKTNKEKIVRLSKNKQEKNINKTTINNKEPVREKVVKLSKNKNNEQSIKDNTNIPKKEKSSSEPKKQQNNNEYLNMEYDLHTINSNYLESKYSPIENDLDSNLKESLDYENAKNYLSKKGTSNYGKKLIQVAGGSKPLHLVSLIHEYLHLLHPEYSEKQIYALTAKTILKLLDEEPEIAKKFEIDKTSKLYKALQRQSTMEKFEPNIADNAIRNILGTNRLKRIIFGNQKYFNSFTKLDEIASNKLGELFNKLTKTKLFKNVKKYFDKSPQVIKDILIEANILEPDKILKQLQGLKEKQVSAIKLYNKIFEKIYAKVESEIGSKKINAINKSGLIQLRAFFGSFEDMIDFINKVSEPTDKELKTIKDNLDFRYGYSKNKFSSLYEAKKLGISEDKFKEYVAKRIKYFMKENDLSIDDIEKAKHLVEMINETQNNVIDKDLLIIGYEPYVLKTFDKLKLAINEEERKELIKKNYKEIEPYVFIVPNIEKDFKSSIINAMSLNRKTGLTKELSKDELDKLPKEIKDKAKIIEIEKDKYKITYFPDKKTFFNVYDKLEPKEILTETFNNLIRKYTTKELNKMSSYKTLISHIVSTEPKKGYIKIETDEAKSFLNNLFKTKNKTFYINKKYKNFFEYKEKLPDNENYAKYIKIYKSLINRLKGNLTYKSFIAYSSNILSGIVGLVNLGVNPKYIPRLIKDTHLEYKEWLKYEKYIPIAYEKGGLQGVKDYLKTIKKNNVFAEIFYDGKIGVLDTDDYILFGQTHDDKALYSLLKKVDNKLGTNNANKVMKGIKTLLLDKETIVGSYLVNMYRNIDLYTRAVGYKYLKMTVGKDEAIKRINDMFVDFKKEPLGFISDIELTGIPFLTFVLRMQGAILKTMYKKPVTTLGLITAYYMLANKNNDDYSGDYRIDSWFLDRVLFDATVFKLSVEAQLLKGNEDKILENMFLPREYVKAYNAIEDKDLEKAFVSKL